MNAKEIMQTLLDNNHEAVICGGYCRDTLLGLKPKDIDIFTNASGEQILKLFPQGKVIGNEERQNKILTVVVDDIEVSQYRKNGDRTELGTDLKTHQSTCDLTINNIACDINGVFDYYRHGDQNDLDNKIIQTVGNPEDRFNEDSLRILRAVRFKTLLGFSMEIDTDQAIRKNISKLLELPPERVRDEFNKMLVSKECFSDLYDYGILQLFLLSSEQFKSVPGGKHHDENLYDHSNNTFMESCNLTDNHLIRLACYLHDIGKINYNQDDITFHNHERDSVLLATDFMNRLKYSKKDIAFVTTMIKHHMMGDAAKIKNNRLIKIYNDLEDAGVCIEDMLVLTYSDNQGNMAKPRIKFNEFYQNAWLKKVYKLKYERLPFRITDLEINGRDVLALGVKGKQIGVILNKIFNEVIEGNITNDRFILLSILKKYIKIDLSTY